MLDWGLRQELDQRLQQLLGDRLYQNQPLGPTMEYVKFTVTLAIDLIMIKRVTIIRTL